MSCSEIERMKDSHIRILSWGGLGDVLLSTPLFRAIKEQKHGVKTTVYCVNDSHYDIYLNNPYIDQLKKIGYLCRAELLYLTRLRSAKLHVSDYGSLLPTCVYSKNATEIIAEMFGITLEHKQVMIFLTREEEETGKHLVSRYSTPVAIHVTSKFTSNQNWPISYWTELVQRNPQYAFLQLGLPAEELIPGVIDLRGKLPLREQFAVLKYARAFVGVDSSFAHVTNAFGTPGVVFFGPSNSLIWGHPNNRNLDLGLPCAPCVDVLARAPCPYGAPCMSGITVLEVERNLELQLASH
jgi:ADP-heptose:LPS heptosyltransferase